MEKENTVLEIDFFNSIKGNKVDQVAELLKLNPELLQAYDYNCFGGTPLTVCSFDNDKKMLTFLLSQGADPNRKSDWWAGGWTPVQIALHKNHRDAARFFIANGAHIGIHEAAGLSMLSELISILTTNPDRISERGGDGCTALHFAGSTAAIDILLEFGADLNSRDIDHYSTPAQYLATHSPELSKYLVDNGAEPDIFTIVLIGDEDRFDSMLKEDPSRLNLRINQETFPPGQHSEVHNILTFIVGGDTNLLHTAAIGQQLTMMEKIVSAGVDIDSTGGYDDSTALHMAAWRDTVEVADALIKLGADIDKRSGKIHNNTPAGWAIVAGSANVFCHLLDKGATIQDYFESSIREGLNGDFMKYKKVPIENFQRMLAVI